MICCVDSGQNQIAKYFGKPTTVANLVHIRMSYSYNRTRSGEYRPVPESRFASVWTKICLSAISAFTLCDCHNSDTEKLYWRLLLGTSQIVCNGITFSLTRHLDYDKLLPLRSLLLKEEVPLSFHNYKHLLILAAATSDLENLSALFRVFSILFPI